MPYTLIYDGVMREFDFYAPPGWQYWVGEAWKQGRRGLPLIVALHGGGEDPLVFQEDWFFPRVWDLGLDSAGNPSDPVSPGDKRCLENQFFVLFPYGQGWMTKSLFDRAFGLIEPPTIPKLPPIPELPTIPELPPNLLNFQNWLNLLANSLNLLHGADLRPLYHDTRTVSIGSLHPPIFIDRGSAIVSSISDSACLRMRRRNCAAHSARRSDHGTVADGDHRHHQLPRWARVLRRG